MDSTACVDESINEYAKMLGKFNKIQALTNRAMNGDLRFEDSFRQRLATLQPTSTNFKQFLASREQLMFKKQLITAGLVEFVGKLRRQGVHVCFITGGFFEIAAMVAKFIGIDVVSGLESDERILCGGCQVPGTVFANKLLFDENGGYSRLVDSPVSKAGGKAVIV